MDDPRALLRSLRRRATDRQLRLFACACCRLLWDRLPDPACRHAVETAEAYADGLLGEDDRRTAHRHFNHIIRSFRGARGRLAQAVAEVLRPRLHPEVTLQRAWTGGAPGALAAIQGELLRDILGRPPLPARPPAGPSFRHGGAVHLLAERIYREREWGSLPVLADLLAEAGCTSEVVLSHCREVTVHARGCWVLDWLLDQM